MHHNCTDRHWLVFKISFTKKRKSRDTA